MKKKLYDSKVLMNFSTYRELKDEVEQLAICLAVESGWDVETEEGGKRPNKSMVLTDLVEAGLEVRKRYGGDWRDHLAVQSEPLWAKEHLAKIEAKIESLLGGLQVVRSQSEQVEAIKQTDNHVGVEDLLG